jgi:hypothetical protein
MQEFSFDEDISVRISGGGKAYDALSEYYQSYTTTSAQGESDFSCTVKLFSPEPEVAVGDPNLYYGRDSDRFVVENTSSTMSLSEDWNDVICTPETSKNSVAYLLEYEMRKQYAELGRGLVHASGVTVDGSTLIFPAWRHTGKTNLMLNLLQEYGGNYISDDRLWVHKNGQVSGYNLPVNMMPYNVKTFAGLSSFSRRERLAAKASNTARWVAHSGDGLVPKAASFLNIFYLEPAAGKRIMIEELLPETSFKRREDADAVVLLQTAPKDDGVGLEETTASEVFKSIVAASHYEWNEELEEFCRVFDSLFEEADRLTEYQNLLDSENEIFESFLNHVPVFKLTIPREEQWAEKGIGKQAISHIETILGKI